MCIRDSYKTKPYTNGNWGIAVTKVQIGISVFLNDTKLYDDALDFFYHGKDNGDVYKRQIYKGRGKLS